MQMTETRNPGHIEDLFATAAHLDGETHGVTREQIRAGLTAVLSTIEPRDSSRPETDLLAANAARNDFASIVRAAGIDIYNMGAESDPGRIADALTSQLYASWERGVSGDGVAVRRYVLRSEWEVDPEALPQ